MGSLGLLDAVVLQGDLHMGLESLAEDAAVLLQDEDENGDQGVWVVNIPVGIFPTLCVGHGSLDSILPLFVSYQMNKYFIGLSNILNSVDWRVAGRVYRTLPHGHKLTQAIQTLTPGLLSDIESLHLIKVPPNRRGRKGYRYSYWPK